MKFVHCFYFMGYWRVIPGKGNTKNGEHPQNKNVYDHLASIKIKINEQMHSWRPICYSESPKYLRIFQVFLDVDELQIAVKTIFLTAIVEKRRISSPWQCVKKNTKIVIWYVIQHTCESFLFTLISITLALVNGKFPVVVTDIHEGHKK